MSQRYLIAGGAGFIGSHLVAELTEAGHDCVVFDNLQTGHRRAVIDGARFMQGDLADAAALHAVFAMGPFDAVFHMADLSQVGESMADPLHYLTTNSGNGGRLIAAAIRHGVPRFVFSSTANLFSVTGFRPIGEDTPIVPASPYGEAKYMVERMLHWAEEVHGLRSACIRYFNAAGSDPQGRFGEDHTPESHLIPLVIDVALGRRAEIVLFGDDYPTPDGTCIRDYVHVSDIARAHTGVLSRLEHGSLRYNLGLGHGYSVREVIDSVARVSGLAIKPRIADRRPGDPAFLVADSSLITQEIGWKPRFDSLDSIVATAFEWRQRHPNGYR
jgi:UDP-glucose 4-epimerase